MKRYGDPANLPPWLPGHRSREALLQVGLVLDDIRLLHSAQIEWAVLTFTLWTRALLLVLAPALGMLSFAAAPDLNGGLTQLVPWIMAVTWALLTALFAPRVASLAMADSIPGLRLRRVLLAVELPIAIAVALTSPSWMVVTFAAGWTNWYQRLGRTPAVPDFSWLRLAAWIALTAGTQTAGLLLAPGDAVWWQVVAEVAAAIGVIAVIGGSYGAMLPASAGVTVRVLFGGLRHQRQADSEAQRMIDEIAEAMVRAADALADPGERGFEDARAAEILRRAVDDMRPVASREALTGPRTLASVVNAALAEGGHDMWVGDPRARAAQDRARDAGRTLPVVVARPEFASADLHAMVLDEAVAATLHRLLRACIVEARVHGMRSVQTVVTRTAGRIELRIANEPNPQPRARRGRGRGATTIALLAARLPGSGDFARGPTDYSFIGGRPAGSLFGVRFSFTVGDTPPRAGEVHPDL